MIKWNNSITKMLDSLKDKHGRLSPARAKKFDNPEIASIQKEYDITLRQLFYLYVNGLNEIPVCLSCGKRIKNFERDIVYCSHHCANNSALSKEKAKATNIMKYGCISPAQNETVKNKARQTCLVKYGTLYPMNVSSIVDKMKQSNMQKYGCVCTLSLDDNKEKRRKTWLSNYGTDNPMKNKIVRSKARQTCLIKYGRETYAGSDDYNHNVPTPQSKSEKEIYDYVKNIANDAISHDRNMLNGLELDIYIPSKQLAIEYNGIYWHSSDFIDENFHMMKWKLCQNKDIRLIHIFETEWLMKKDICKSLLKSAMDIYDNVIDSQTCNIIELDEKTYHDFMIFNCIDSYRPCTYCYGLIHDSSLVFAAGFVDDKLMSFSNKINTCVQNGLERISSIRTIYDYDMDRCKYDVKDFIKAGLVHIADIEPQYFYASKTEISEHDKGSGYYKIYNAGRDKLRWIQDEEKTINKLCE